MHYRLLMAVGLLQAQLYGQQAGTNSIAGTVSADNNAPVMGARVLAILQAERAEGFKQHTGYAVADAAGKFEIANLPDGKYEVCAHLPGSDLIDPCQWGQPGVALQLGAGKTNKATANFSLAKGNLVRIQVDDEAGYLSRHENLSAGGFLMAGVVAPGNVYVSAVLETDRKVSRSYRVFIPAGRSFRLRILSPLFQIESPNEAVQSLRILQDLDQVLLTGEREKTFIVKVKGIQDLAGPR